MKVALSTLLLLFSFYSHTVPLKVAFVYVSPPGDAGWSYSHELARQYLENTFGDSIQTKVIDSVPEGRKAREVIEDLAKDSDIVFTTSWGYMIPTQRIAEQYPNVKFEHATGLRRGDNLSTYATRAYEARYLSGMVAAAMSKSKRLGYVAAHPIAEVIRGLNAFTLGAQSIDPSIKVEVQWTNAWYAPDKSKKLTHALIDNGADVIAHHVDTPTPLQVAEARGVYAIGYHTDMSVFAPNSHLVSVVHDWGKIYASRIQSVMDNTWSSTDLWPGLKQNSSHLTSLSPKLPAEIVDKVTAATAAIQSGALTIFSGPINNHRSRQIIREGETLSDSDILRMDWYAQGIEGDLRFF
ncbi:BMP family ABC transporter substrate-binding protein [Bermanella sp. WJH001]|uniref:BMP family ABC transporter substrate-binding protein n=1 Tax=Bermanella sp. WJH001 TaxID=3048005 RepID=UPI0024BDE12B|nr:BMP family ABC transporter substrate-binding protein [Bermanella sp. WJH001]MDJ1538391.1 BMP family ABC transporter substrate-binding protein [Bermanella sp. WJH001]